MPNQTTLVQDDRSFLKLRENQVIEMIAGKKKYLSTQDPWPEPSTKVMSLWLRRHPSYQTFSSNYMASQKRFLFLADILPQHRFEAFERICFLRQIAPTTAESYWTTWLGAQKALAVQTAESDARVSKILKARSIAYPVQFPTPATMIDMEALVTTFRVPLPSLTAIVMFAFLNGQRISDMLQLAVADLNVTESFLMITVRRGKTMSVSQPYTLWMRRGRYPAETLIDLASNAKKDQRLFLFSEFNSEEERSKMSHVIRDMITSINDQLELRSLRRGGLQRMAQLGFSMDVLLQFSRHSDVKMLMRYLAWGEHSTKRQSEMIQVIDATMHDMSVEESLTTNPTTNDGTTTTSTTRQSRE